MKATNGVPIISIDGDPTNIIGESDLPVGIVADIVKQVDLYLAEHPSMDKVYIYIHGWWESFSILPTQDLSEEDLGLIHTYATLAPKTQAPGAILGFLKLRGR